MVASSYKANGILDQELEEELMKFTNKCEETKSKANFVVDHTQSKIYRDADVEVDIITGRAKSCGNEMVEAERIDSTESSSSFDGSDCGVEDFDAESAIDFDSFRELYKMRKKTNYWRSFIKPLMWRCKWVELQIKRFEAEAQKYNREIERCRQQKLARLKGFTLDDRGVKSLPFSGNRVGEEVFTRKRRRRDEATEDIAAYMSRHNLFSCFENSGRLTNGALTNIDLKSHVQSTQKVEAGDEFWGNNDLLCAGDGDDDSCMEDIFRKINFLQSRVRVLKSRADKITNENEFYGSCLDNYAPTNDDVDGLHCGASIVSQLIAEYKLIELSVTESAVKSCQEAVRDDDSRTDRVYFDPTENDDYKVLIDNPRIKEQMINFEELYIQPIQRPVLAEPNQPADDKRSPITRSILKTESTNKRKRDGSRVRFTI